MKTTIFFAIATLIAANTFAQDANIKSKTAVDTKTSIKSPKAEAGSQSSSDLDVSAQTSKAVIAEPKTTPKPVVAETQTPKPVTEEAQMAPKPVVGAVVEVKPAPDPKQVIATTTAATTSVKVKSAETGEATATKMKTSVRTGVQATTSTTAAVHSAVSPRIIATSNQALEAGSQSVRATSAVRPVVKLQSSTSNNLNAKPVSVKTKAVANSQLRLR